MCVCVCDASVEFQFVCSFFGARVCLIQICSALKYVKRAVVGTCSARDSASLKAWLDARGFGSSSSSRRRRSSEEATLVTVWRPAVPLGYGDDINNQTYKDAGAC